MLGQRIWDKVSCYWERVGEHIGNFAEHIETHLMGYIENNKIHPPKNKNRTPLVQSGSPHWLPKISMPYLCCLQFLA